MRPEDGGDARPREDRERSNRESEFSRRELLRAGSAVPVVLSAGWLAACGSHSDAHGDHTDAPHNDAVHTDSGGQSGSGGGHSDTGGHGNQGGHNDTGKHNDAGHNDAPHNDAPHNDAPNHGDLPSRVPPQNFLDVAKP